MKSLSLACLLHPCYSIDISLNKSLFEAENVGEPFSQIISFKPYAFKNASKDKTITHF